MCPGICFQAVSMVPHLWFGQHGLATEKWRGGSIHSITVSCPSAMKTWTKNRTFPLGRCHSGDWEGWKCPHWTFAPDMSLWGDIHLAGGDENLLWCSCELVLVIQLTCTRTQLHNQTSARSRRRARTHTHLKTPTRSNKSTNSKFDLSSITGPCLLLEQMLYQSCLWHCRWLTGYVRITTCSAAETQYFPFLMKIAVIILNYSAENWNNQVT